MLQGNIQSGPLTGSVWSCKKKKKKSGKRERKDGGEEERTNKSNDSLVRLHISFLTFEQLAWLGPGSHRIYFWLFFLVMARLYNFFLRRAQLVTFYMQISDRSLLPPTTTETARVSPACTCIAVGQNLTANKSIYDLQKN